jgi:MoaA/NifB/PqqE/SkfB family radical SAM enzyme
LDVLLEVARWVRQHYGRPLQIRVDTNGHGNLLNRGRDVAAELKAAGIDKVSVSLNAGGSLLERLTLRKTSLFEFEVPSYRKRRVGLTANHKQSI